MRYIGQRKFTFMLICLIILSTYIDYILSGPYQFISILAPSTGIMFVMHMIDRKRYDKVILTTYALSVFVSRLLIVDESFLISILVTAFKVVVMVLMFVLITHIMHHLKNKGYQSMDLKDIFNFIFIGIFVTFVGATLHLIPIFLLFDYEVPIFWYGNAWIGNMFGFFIFGSSLNYALIFDEFKFNVKRFLYSLLFVFGVFMISHMLFLEVIPNVDYRSYSYIFLVLYIFGTIYFDFIVIYLSNLFLYLAYSLFYFDYDETFDLSNELTTIILILLALTGVSVLIRYSLSQLKKKAYQLEETNETMKKMFLSTKDIMKHIGDVSVTNQKLSNEFFVTMFEMAKDVFMKFDKASLFVRSSKQVVCIKSFGYDEAILTEMNIDPVKYNLNYNKPVLIVDKEYIYPNDEKIKETLKTLYPEIKESIRMIIYFDGKPVAGMAFDITMDNPDTFNDNDLKSFQEFYELINSYYKMLVVHNANQAYRDDVTIGFVRALGMFDSYTGNHSQEVAFLALEIATRMKLPQEQINRIYWSSIVHDIGKIGVPPEIIRKDGKLTNDEYEEVKMHSMHGFNVLNSINGLKDVALRVKHHHERWDGLGYPDGLVGNEIPLCSQILTVCDAVSAMSMDRVYSNSKSIKEMLDELIKEKGKQFSPKVAEVMIEYIQETKLEEFYMRFLKDTEK